MTDETTRRRGFADGVTAADGIALLVVVAVVVVRSWQATRGFWLNDDWGFLRESADPLALDRLFIVHGGHLSVTQYLLPRVAFEIAPASYPTAVLLIGILQAVAAALVYLVLRRLFGSRPMIVLLLVIFAFASLTLSSSLWPAVSSYMLPLQIASAAALLLLLRYLDRPTPWRAAAVVVAVVVGLLSFERAVFLPFLLFVVAAWFPVPSERPVGARAALRAHWGLWASLGLLLAAYAVLYLVLDRFWSTPSTIPEFDASPEEVGQLIARSVGGGFATSLFGGPWRWTDAPVEVAADPPTIAAALATAALIAFVAYTWVRRPVARLPWLFLIAYLAIAVGLIAYSRLSATDFEAGGYYRFFADLALPTVLVLGLSLLPTRSERADLPDAELPPSISPLFVVGLTVAFVVSASFSATGAWGAWSRNEGKSYVANARAGFGQVAETGLLPQTTPPAVLGPLFSPFNTTALLFQGVPNHPPFRSTVDRLFALDPGGHIEQTSIVGWQSTPGPEPGCGWQIEAPGGAAPLDGEPYAWPWYVGVSYDASESFEADVALGDGRVRVPFERGRHDVYFPITGGGPQVTFDDLPRGTSLCVDSLRVGSLDAELSAADRRSG